MYRLSAAFISLCVLGAASSASAQSNYPKSPIRFINASSAGGASDIFMRALADELQKAIKQPTFIENRPGGGLNIAARACADAEPNGYTFCVFPGDVLVYNPHLFKTLPFDPDTSFEPVITLFKLPLVLAVRSDLNVKTIDELASLSRAKPKTLSYVAPGISQAVFIEDFINRDKGGDLVKIPFRGGGDVVTGIMNGTTPIAFFGVSNLIGLLESKAVVGLAVDTKHRLRTLPDVPTVHEIGFKGDMTTTFFALFAPAKTPKSSIDLMRTEIEKVLASSEFRRRYITDRDLLPAEGPDDEIRELLARERLAGQQVFRASGLTPQ